MPVMSTMGIGIAGDGTVERYVPPRVIEEGGGGGPPPGPPDHLQVSSAMLPWGTANTPNIAPLTVPAGDWLIWAEVVGVLGTGIGGVSFMLDGWLTTLSGGMTGFTVSMTPQRRTYATATTISVTGNATGGGTIQTITTTNALQIR